MTLRLPLSLHEDAINKLDDNGREPNADEVRARRRGEYLPGGRAMIAPGDIVSAARHPGLWIVVGPGINTVPPGQQWRVRQKATDGRLIGLTVGEGDLTLLYRPDLGAGRTVKHQDTESVIVADLGDRVRVTLPAQSRPLDHDPNVTVRIPQGEGEVGKADIVVENLTMLIKEAIQK